VAQAETRLRRALNGALEQRRARLAAAAQFLNAVSYRNVLKRGFALVRDDAGAPLHKAAAIAADQPIRIEFADGEIGAVARGSMGPGPGNPPGKGAPSGRLARPRKQGLRDDQGSLF
jgi:exodeoxyribonuclease VII large subunit